MIPVQNIIKNQVELGKVDIEYKDHPLELAFAFTVWKVQGLTFDKIIHALELLKGKNWTFENLYVGFLRITTINSIRCLPLSQRFDRRKFLNLRPNINTTRWKMDTLKGNKWIKNPKSAELRDKVKKKESDKSNIKRSSPTNKSTRDKKQKNKVEIDKKYKKKIFSKRTQ